MESDWKKHYKFPINFESEHSSEEDLDNKDVISRHPPRSSHSLLADYGDGAEADLLGTTPPRTTRRENKLKRDQAELNRRNTIEFSSVDSSATKAMAKKPETVYRGRDRDIKLNISRKEHRADSLPSPEQASSGHTMVESCNHFMSLKSRLKCRDKPGLGSPGDKIDDRVRFHNTFSMLIKMGNSERGCRRAISREEQVWQNELKDLIWLELQAKIAGRTLGQQDAYLCTQRKVVPTVIQNIIDYRFVNRNRCNSNARSLCVMKTSQEDLTKDVNGDKTDKTEDNADDDERIHGCLSLNCQHCANAVGKAMREVGTLLDSFFNAMGLYQSSKAMTVDHPLVATQLFQNRLKAMCLWYNVALHMRLKILAFRRLIRALTEKVFRKYSKNLSSDTSCNTSRQTSETHRVCQVRFDLSGNPTDSSNSDSSHESKEEQKRSKTVECQDQENICTENYEDKKVNVSADSKKEKLENDSGEENKNDEESKKGVDQVDNRLRKISAQSTAQSTAPSTPEIVLDSRYNTTDSSESGYSSVHERELERDIENIYDLGSMQDFTSLKLLGNCSESLYRKYHYEILKTQGVRRSMMFLDKMRKNMLAKVYITLLKPNCQTTSEKYLDENSTEVFEDTKEEEKTESDDIVRDVHDLKRYGCWSEENIAMRLPSYRNHFILLSSLCMEAMHDYLSLRLEGTPEKPSALTVKQLIHEMKEGLDIACDVRATYVRNIEAALQGDASATRAPAASELLKIIRTFDSTVEAVLKQYLSYLRTMSEVEHLPRSRLQAEWEFAARLARRVKTVALLAPETFTDIACNQLDRVSRRINEKFMGLDDKEKEKFMDLDDQKKIENEARLRQMVYALCRSAQQMYAEEHEAILQGAQWARALCVRLSRARTPGVRQLRTRIFDSLMTLRGVVYEHSQLILDRSKETKNDELEMSRDTVDSLMARVRELLLQVYRVGFEIHKEIHRVVAEPCINKMSSNPLRRAYRLARSESIAEDTTLDDKLLDNIHDSQKQTSIELLLSEAHSSDEPVLRRNLAAADCGDNGDCDSSESQWAARGARACVQFAQSWMRFVMERCDRGRGLRPRWASQGLEFLMLACDPCNTKHLTDEEFKELTDLMDKCISHVIGSRKMSSTECSIGSTPPSGRRATRSASPCAHNNVPTPPTPPTEPEPILNFAVSEPSGHGTRVVEAVRKLDASRDSKLRSAKAVGRVVESTVTLYEPKLRQVTFKWQRGLKIGAGTFGKVYTVVNTDTGQLLAMKEISIGAGDRRALQKAANELRVLEGVIHPHLVRYYGCEVHREEMLIFMELCVEGSLETLVARSGELPEHTVRKYTRQLTSAVLELHNRAIAHRDIKSGNVFLTNEGHCLKLGDFGCAVKIRANTTAAGELQGCVGTQAYMAPEVFMKSSGHGRAADIWSLGCVVTEMASGKRPFSEYDSNYQIMFVVGMGTSPNIPDTLSPEGTDFCKQCFTREPDQRPKAQTLMLHHFLMVKDDDCHCEPGFLIY